VDMSGSMRLDSLLGQPAAGAAISAARLQSINPEADYPKFGHYSSTPHTYSASSSTTWQAPTGELAGVGNIVAKTDDGPAVVGDFYAGSTAFDTGTQAFVNAVTPAPGSYDTNPKGDQPAYKQGSTTVWASNMNDMVGRTTANTSSADGTDSKDTTWE